MYLSNLSLYATLLWLIGFCVSCTSESKTKIAKEQFYTPPTVSPDGNTIALHTSESMRFFQTQIVKIKDINKKLDAIGRVAAITVTAKQGNKPVIVLFENPELTSSYIDITHHQINISQIQNINIKQKEIELARIEDLHKHGAATGKDLLDAQTALSMEKTNLANEKAGIVEHEVKLKSNGFNPNELDQVPAGIAYIICHIPENQITKIHKGYACQLKFTSYPNETFEGKIEDIAEVIDNTTRMVRLRILVSNIHGKFKAGMFVSATFNLEEGNFVSIPKSALVTVQGKHYVFIKQEKHKFRRQRIEIGAQVGEQVIVLNGISENEEIAIEGVLQLKGLAFGY